MKYIHEPANLTLEERVEVNTKLLYLIKQNTTGDYNITGQDVYSNYTGVGGLHGLSRKDYDSYHAYSEAKKEVEAGQFFTPHHLAEFLVDSLQVKPGETVVDLTCGMGNFFNFLPDESRAYGVELDYSAYLIAKFLYPKASIHHDDVRVHDVSVKADFMVLNPPFNLVFNGQPSQTYVLHKAHDSLRSGGVLAVIVPASFMADDFSQKNEIAGMNDRFSFLGQYLLPRKAFDTADVSTKIMYFFKRSEHIAHTPYTTDYTELSEYSDAALTSVRSMLNRFYVLRDSKRMSLRQEEVSHLETQQGFVHKVNKYLYDISVNPKTKTKLGKAESYYNKFLTQKKPEAMSVEDWARVKLTENKVLSYLKRTLAEQSVVERDEVRLVKTDAGVKFKGYSRKTRRSLTTQQIEPTPLHELFYSNTLGFSKLVDRKRVQHENQTKPYNEIHPEDYPEQKNFVNNLTLNHSDGSRIILNDIQQEDTIRMLTKRYGYLQWDTGAGKTVSAMAQILYRQKFDSVRNVYVVSNAIAIDNTWRDELDSYGFDAVKVKTITDVYNIQPGQVVLLTFDALNKLRRFIRQHVRMNSYKTMLVLDEADNISNIHSQRYKSVLVCFRRSKIKLLMSATSTRNNVAESFSAFELMYNNSMNFINHAPALYREPRTTKEATGSDGFVMMLNSSRGKPFSPYSKGFLEFRRSFSPAKSTVFGVKKQSQEVYNPSYLQEIISYSMITRSFEEVSHKDLYSIQQETVSFSEDEQELYTKLLNEFYSFYGMFNSTGSSRKDSMLRIIQQLNSLLRAPVQPEKYDSAVSSSKYPRLKKLCADKPDEYIAVGATNVSVVHQYAEQLKADFPDRKIMVITATDASLKKRKQMVKELKDSGNGILVCTQQSLSSSMNIDFVDNVVLLQMQWNFPAMKQFFARFVRFTSLYPKTITFLLNSDSIETNLLKLLLAKEKMNLFMKNVNSDDDELYDYFGVSSDFFETLFSKEVDKNGKSYIAWG